MATISPARASDQPAARRSTLLTVSGLLGCLLAGLLLFARFGLNGLLSRDEGIYVYGGEQLARHGTAPYVSIFDPKGPGATLLCALLAAIGRVVGADQLSAIRVGFLIMSLLTVGAVYLLVLTLWGSRLGAFAAGVAFASFFPFAVDALAGPDAKTPGVLFLVLAMWFAARRRWAASAVMGSLAFLVWQPFFIYPLMTLVAALCLGDADAPARRGPHWRAFGRSLLATVIPVAVVAIYFAAAGAMSQFLESAVRFPLTGIQRGSYSFRSHVHLVKHVAEKFAGPLFWIGLVLLVFLVVATLAGGDRSRRGRLANPVVYAVATTAVLGVLYALFDFQWYPDLLPLLAYPAIGIGGTVALVHRWVASPRSAGSAGPAGSVASLGAAAIVSVVVVAAVALTSYQFVQFGRSNEIGGLVDERRMACVENAVVGDGQLYSLGNPAALVLTGRTNPDRFIYLDSGVGRWKIKHTPGGLVGWYHEIRRAEPRMIIDDGWQKTSSIRLRLIARLRNQGFVSRYVGTWHVLVPRWITQSPRTSSLGMTRQPHQLAADVCRTDA